MPQSLRQQLSRSVGHPAFLPPFAPPDKGGGFPRSFVLPDQPIRFPEESEIFCLLIRMWVTESHTKKLGSVQRDRSSPALRPLEGKAAATWTGGAYEGGRENGQEATSLREAAPAKPGNALACLPSLLRRSSFGYEGRELRRNRGGPFGQTQVMIFQHSHHEISTPPGLSGIFNGPIITREEIFL